MDYEKEREKQAAAADVEADVNVADAVDEVMKKYDRESNTRIWEGKPKLVVKTIMALFSLYCIIVTLFVSGLLEDPYHRLPELSCEKGIYEGKLHPLV